MRISMVEQMVPFPKITPNLHLNLTIPVDILNVMVNIHNPILPHNLVSTNPNSMVSILNLGLFLTII